MASPLPSAIDDPYRAQIEQAGRIDPGRFRPLLNMLSARARCGHISSRMLLVLRDSGNGPSGFAAHALRDIKTAADLICSVQKAQQENLSGLCIVENISSQALLELGQAWKVNPKFFADHAANKDGKNLWKHSSWTEPVNEEAQHLHGIYECHGPETDAALLQRSKVNHFERLVVKDGTWPINISTMLSYCNISRTSVPIYLILVDASPFDSVKPDIKDILGSTQQDSLRFPYSVNRGGLIVLPNASEQQSLFDTLDNIFCQHPWHLDFVLAGPRIFPGVPILYLISCSVLQTNLKELERSLFQISYIELANPDWRLTGRLHDLRRRLAQLRAVVAETSEYEPSSVEEFFRAHQAQDCLRVDISHGYEFYRTPRQRLSSLSQRADFLYGLAVESFNILLGTVAVLGSEESRKQTEESLKQTRQSILLTILATVYLPLSLATGIFGMNLSEMVGQGPRVWTFVVTTVALTCATVMVFGIAFHEQILSRVKRFWRRQRH